MQVAGWVATLLVAVLVGAALLTLGQRRIVFPGTALTPDRAPSEVPPGVQQTWLATSDGRVEGWFLPADSGAPTAAIVFAHGNAELIDHWPYAMGDLTAAGVAVLLVEYPGYGHSEGKPTRTSIQDTFAAAYDWLAARPDVRSDGILAMGRSLGGGAAVDLDGQRDLAGLILLSTFSSAAQMAWEAFRMPGFLVWDDFDNAAGLRGSNTPALVLHGTRDEVIPYSHGQTLADQRSGLEPVPLDCGHNDCMAAWPAIVARVLEFVDRAVPR